MTHRQLQLHLDALLAQPAAAFDNNPFRRMVEEDALRQLCEAAIYEPMPNNPDECRKLASSIVGAIAHMGIPMVHPEILEFIDQITESDERADIVMKLPGWLLVPCHCYGLGCVGYRICTQQYEASRQHAEEVSMGLIAVLLLSNLGRRR